MTELPGRCARDLLGKLGSYQVKRVGQIVKVYGIMQTRAIFCRTTGLKRMARNHIHFASPPARSAPGGPVILPGLRTRAELLLYLDVAAALGAGIPLFRSANGVVLSPGLGAEGCILPSFFTAVEAGTNRQIWPPLGGGSEAAAVDAGGAPAACGWGADSEAPQDTAIQHVPPAGEGPAACATPFTAAACAMTDEPGANR